MDNILPLIVRDLGIREYQPVWTAMQDFTDRRDAETKDELWLVEHLPVFTQGQAGKPEHLLATGDIPVVQVDRGGQVTYHGPGQIVAYPLLDLRRKNIGVRQLVRGIENALIAVLKIYGIKAGTRADAPGVYIDGEKIASLGLRIRRGCSFHGLAFNICMDLEPFERINPCGFRDLPVTQLSAFSKVTPAAVKPVLVRELGRVLGYNYRYSTDTEPAAASVG